jgi:hypothetical protein
LYSIYLPVVSRVLRSFLIGLCFNNAIGFFPLNLWISFQCPAGGAYFADGAAGAGPGGGGGGGGGGISIQNSMYNLKKINTLFNILKVQ